MPAEAVHLSALHDSLAVAPAAVRAALAEPMQLQAARLGALFVDMPYFEGFAWSMLRYLLRRPPKYGGWGDVFHNRAPIAVGRALGEEGARLARSAATREAGELLTAISLGYISHAAVDTALHPMINGLAAQRAAALGDAPARQHQEVEKFQSILFHQQRFGFDFMGTETLRTYIAMNPRLLGRVWGEDSGALGAAVDAALLSILGDAPGRVRFRRWTAGYAQYVWTIASPVGKTIAPPAEKERERPQVFDGLDFPGRFARAVQQSLRWMTTLHAYLADGVFDERARAALHAEIPEGTIDPPGEAPSPSM